MVASVCLGGPFSCYELDERDMHVLLDADTQVIVEEYQLCWLVVKLNRLFGLANQTFLFVDQKARLCSANEEVL